MSIASRGHWGQPFHTSGKVSSLPFNDPPGPSTAIRHSPTAEGRESADDTYSEGQDEDNGCRRKRRPRSELILAYQCSVCGKRYASSQALYQHRRNSHKQPPVAGVGHSDATKVAIPVLPKEARVHPNASEAEIRNCQKFFLLSVWHEVWQSSRSVYSHKKKTPFMTEEQH